MVDFMEGITLIFGCVKEFLVIIYQNFWLFLGLAVGIMILLTLIFAGDALIRLVFYKGNIGRLWDHYLDK